MEGIVKVIDATSGGTEGSRPEEACVQHPDDQNLYRSRDLCSVRALPIAIKKSRLQQIGE